MNQLNDNHETERSIRRGRGRPDCETTRRCKLPGTTARVIERPKEQGRLVVGWARVQRKESRSSCGPFERVRWRLRCDKARRPDRAARERRCARSVRAVADDAAANASPSDQKSADDARPGAHMG